MENISMFEKSSASQAVETLTVRSFLKNIQQGRWKKYQEKVKKAKTKEEKTKIKRFQVPCVTISGVFDNKRTGFPDKHSGFICIDVDAKDNPDLMKRRKTLEDDNYIFAAFTSISGKGLALMFKITPKYHYQMFNAIQAYMYKKYNIVVDGICKDPTRLRFVSYDPDCYVDFKKRHWTEKIDIAPAPVIEDDEHSEEDIADLVRNIKKQGIDIVPTYTEWYTVGQALARLGEKGRKHFHAISELGESYNKEDCDNQFDSCLEQESKSDKENRVGLGSIFFYAKEHGINIGQPKIKHKKHAKLVEEHKSLVHLSLDGTRQTKSIFTYHIWSFKVIFRKDQRTDIECMGLNPECVSDFLYNRGIRQNGKLYYRISGTVVENVTWGSILDMVIQEGVRLPKDFKIVWDDDSDEIIRKAILNAVQSSGRRTMERDIALKEFLPENAIFMSDTETECYLYYQNGVVEVTKRGWKLIPYEDIESAYIWKDNILPRDFVVSKKKSVIQDILWNAVGKDHWKEIQSVVGYMVHGFIPGEGAEILFCIDRSVGDINEGGNGKDFFSQIIGNVRKVTRIAGKQMQFSNQFIFEKMDRDTQIMWIEDLGKHVKMEQLYNMHNGVTVRKLHQKSFTVHCKVGVSLQHLINIEGTSDQRRQVFLLFTDYYSKKGGIGKVHGDRDIFGKAWKGWQEYDTFIVNSVQQYLKSGLVRMDISPLTDLRRAELSDGTFESLVQGTWYGTESAMKLCWGDDAPVTIENLMAFRRKLHQWAKLSGLEIEAERKSISGKQQKAIRVCAPMTYKRTKSN